MADNREKTMLDDSPKSTEQAMVMKSERKASVKPVVERTLVMLKPEVLENDCVGSLLSNYEDHGLAIKAIKLITPSEFMIRKHYMQFAHDRKKMQSIIANMTRGPCVFIVYEGLSAVKKVVFMNGESNPALAEPGTIRSIFRASIEHNFVHGSDSVESARAEIDLWFGADLI